MVSLIFCRPQGGKVEIGLGALEILERHAQRERRRPEAGGVLLGRWILGAPDVVVDEVTTPQPGDRCGRTWFFRSRQHQGLAEQAWHDSGGTRNYLGEWHTHPEATPSPSWVDRRDWLRRLHEDTVDAEAAFFVIVGTREIVVWEGDRARLRLERLRRC